MAVNWNYTYSVSDKNIAQRLSFLGIVWYMANDIRVDPQDNGNFSPKFYDRRSALSLRQVSSLLLCLMLTRVDIIWSH